MPMLGIGKNYTNGDPNIEMQETDHDRLLERRSLPSPSPVPLTRFQILRFLLASTGLYVAAGICFMLLGTLIVQVAILKKIYKCPGGATCSDNFDPSGDTKINFHGVKFSLNVLSLTQSLMQYWLQLGCIIAGLGIARLMAYRSWLIMMREGTTIKTLEKNFGALSGSVSDAALLLPQRSTRSLGLLILIQIIITMLISAIIAFSISSLTFPLFVTVDFQYPQNITLFDTFIYRGITTEKTIAIVTQLNEWLTANDTLRGRAASLHGTLVLQDNRTVYGINAQPSGFRVAGNVSCSSTGVSIKQTGNDGGILNIYNVSSPATGTIQVQMVNIPPFPPLAWRPYPQWLTSNLSSLWFSTNSSRLPDAVMADDGLWSATACYHTVSMDEIPTTYGQSQLLKPSIFAYSNGSALWSGNYITVFEVMVAVEYWWWNTIQNDTVPNNLTPANTITCWNGTLAPSLVLDTSNDFCELSNVTWSNTLAAVLDAMVQTAMPSVNFAEQPLMVETVSMNTYQWWLQAIIPFSIFLLYIACLVYPMSTRHNLPVTALSLLEYTRVAFVTEGMQDVAEQLKESTRVGGSIPSD